SVLIAMGKESDVRAWVDDAPHWEITGLADWETLTFTAASEATETPSETAEATETPSETAEATETPSETAEATETPSESASPEEGEDDAEAEPLPNPSGS